MPRGAAKKKKKKLQHSRPLAPFEQLEVLATGDPSSHVITTGSRPPAGHAVSVPRSPPLLTAPLPAAGTISQLVQLPQAFGVLTPASFGSL